MNKVKELGFEKQYYNLRELDGEIKISGLVRSILVHVFDMKSLSAKIVKQETMFFQRMHRKSWMNSQTTRN